MKTPLFLLLFPLSVFAHPPKTITIRNARLSLSLEIGDRACITSMIVNGQKVLSGADGAFTSVTIGGATWSSLHLRAAPMVAQRKDSTIISGILYGEEAVSIRERWIFITSDRSIRDDRSSCRSAL